MRITEKLVSQLQPGDVLAPVSDFAGIYPRRVFGYLKPGYATPPGSPEQVILATIAAVAPVPTAAPAPMPPPETRPADAILRVEVPDALLVPHEIETVLQALGEAMAESSQPGGSTYAQFRSVADRLKPAPPTLGDVLKALENLAGASSPSNLDAAMRLIQTARSAGVWPA